MSTVQGQSHNTWAKSNYKLSLQWKSQHIYHIYNKGVCVWSTTGNAEGVWWNIRQTGDVLIDMHHTFTDRSFQYLLFSFSKTFIIHLSSCHFTPVWLFYSAENKRRSYFTLKDFSLCPETEIKKVWKSLIFTLRKSNSIHTSKQKEFW